jgi:hypothetical protein
MEQQKSMIEVIAYKTWMMFPVHAKIKVSFTGILCYPIFTFCSMIGTPMASWMCCLLKMSSVWETWKIRMRTSLKS